MHSCEIPNLLNRSHKIWCVCPKGGTYGMGGNCTELFVHGGVEGVFCEYFRADTGLDAKQVGLLCAMDEEWEACSSMCRIISPMHLARAHQAVTGPLCMLWRPIHPDLGGLNKGCIWKRT